MEAATRRRGTSSVTCRWCPSTPWRWWRRRCCPPPPRPPTPSRRPPDSPTTSPPSRSASRTRSAARRRSPARTLGHQLLSSTTGVKSLEASLAGGEDVPERERSLRVKSATVTPSVTHLSHKHYISICKFTISLKIFLGH